MEFRETKQTDNKGKKQQWTLKRFFHVPFASDAPLSPYLKRENE